MPLAIPHRQSFGRVQMLYDSFCDVGQKKSKSATFCIVLLDITSFDLPPHRLMFYCSPPPLVFAFLEPARPSVVLKYSWRPQRRNIPQG